jgi:magnesium transporter
VFVGRHSKLPVHTDALIVTDEEQRYLGELSMEALVTSSPDALVASVMDVDASPVRVDTPEHDVAAMFEKRELVSVAVVDVEQRLIGRITIDDVIEVIREEADQQYLKSAGLDQEEDLFAPVVPSAQRRGLWLGINLITVFMAAWVIGQFEAALSQIVALAVLMPIVASMGGITGSQTLTLTIRGLALEQISVGNVRWLMNKELAVGALNGLVWSLVVAVVAYFWFGDMGLAGVIAIAMILNMLVAALSGVLIPFGLKVVGIDPALSGAVILTTVTDIMGFLCFLGLASAFLI